MTSSVELTIREERLDMICEYRARKYCSEPLSNIENYEKAIADTTQTWACHHRLEINPFNSNREDRGIVSQKQLMEDEMFWNRPACELIFLTKSEHSSLHHKGKTLSDEHRRRLSESHKSENLSEETKRRLSESHKGKHLSEEGKKKVSKAMRGNTYVKGRLWWHKGDESKMSKDCPGEGWERGRK